MPRKELMSYEGEPFYRWVKMYKGVRYRVACKDLPGVRLHSKEATTAAANEWWQRKVLEIEGAKLAPESHVLGRILGTHTVKDLRARVRKGLEEARKAEEALAILEQAGKVDDNTGWSQAQEDGARMLAAGNLPDRAFTNPFGQVLQGEQRIAHVERIEAELVPEPVASDRTLRVVADRFLDLARGEMRPVTYTEVRDAVNASVKFLGDSFDVATVDELVIERLYLWQKGSGKSDVYKKKRWNIIRRFVRWCYESRLMEMPRNLETYSFTARAKTIKGYDLIEVRKVLAALPSRCRVFALLALNCGMLNADIGRLTKDMVDLDKGRLVRRRGKTEDHKDVPTVDYTLWPETMSALKENWSDHPTLVLTSTTGTPLWSQEMRSGQDTAKNDLIVQWWRKAKVVMPLKAFRSISSTVIGSHETYAIHAPYFLGHAPRTVADRHYVKPSRELFDKIMNWLRGEIMG